MVSVSLLMPSRSGRIVVSSLKLTAIFVVRSLEAAPQLVKGEPLSFPSPLNSFAVAVARPRTKSMPARSSPAVMMSVVANLSPIRTELTRGVQPLPSSSGVRSMLPISLPSTFRTWARMVVSPSSILAPRATITSARSPNISLPKASDVPVMGRVGDWVWFIGGIPHLPCAAKGSGREFTPASFSPRRPCAAEERPHRLASPTARAHLERVGLCIFEGPRTNIGPLPENFYRSLATVSAKSSEIL